MKWQFKEDHTLDQRCQESNKIRQKYPDRIPVIVQKVEGSNIEKIDKRKYLVSWLLKDPILHMDPKWYVPPIKSINQLLIGSSRYYRRPIYVDYPKKNKLAIRTSHLLIRWQNGATIKVRIFSNLFEWVTLLTLNYFLWCLKWVTLYI